MTWLVPSRLPQDRVHSGRGEIGFSRFVSWIRWTIGMGLWALIGWLALDCSSVLVSSACGDAPPPPTGSEYLVRAWGTEDGLPENSATAIVQTREHYLWFGTFNGLVRFNGDNFRVFNPANTPQLPSAGIVNLYADKRDRLWVSTLEGLVIKDSTQWRALGTNGGWAGNYVRSFAERANGDLLLTTFDGHVLAIDHDQLTELPQPPGETGQAYLGTVDENGQWWLAQNRFVGYWSGQQWVQAQAPRPSLGRSRVACASARGGGVWVLLGNEVLRFREKKEVSRLTLPQLKGGIWSLSEDSRANLWIASYDSGLFQVAPGGDVRHWTTTNGLGSLSARVVFEDDEENLWIGSSGGGLRRFKLRRFSEVGAGTRLSGRLARSVSQAHDGGMWIATFDHGLLRQDHTGISPVSVPGPTNRSAYGLSVLEDRAGGLWYGDADGCWWRRGQGGFEKAPVKTGVSALFEDSKGRVWIATREGAVVSDGSRFQPLGPEAGLPRGEIVCFGEDSSGLVWLAGAAGVFREEKEHFTEVRTGDGRALQGVLCFKADVDGALWMGTRRASLIRWRNEKVDVIGVNHGLPEREVRGIIEDGQGHFWMPSNRGLIRASRKQLNTVADRAVSHLEFQLLDQSDGLPSIEFSPGQPNSARDAAGRLYFATQKGVVVIDPAGFRLNSHPPPVLVEELTYLVATGQPKGKGRHTSGFGERVRLSAPFPEPLRLPPGSYGLDLHYAALSFSAPEKVRFEYKLEGGSRDWEDAGALRVATFHQLPPGEYVFRVRAANSDGVWNEAGTSLAFTVLPYFWQTRWFLSGTALLLIALGGALVWSWSHRRVVWALERERLAVEMQQLRDELAHSSRVSTMGQLASALAHELGQPLGAILRNTEAAELLIEREPPDLAEIRAILTDIRLDDQRAAGVIQGMRALLKRRDVEWTSLSLADLVADVAALIRPDVLQRQVRLAIDIPAGIPPVYGDRIQLQQVLLNLLVNGMDAMSHQPPPTRRLAVQARQTEARMIEVAVRDSGPGIHEQSVDRVFEPFYSTKPQGMGLGLAVSKTIIEAHKGRIWAENRAEGGASFCFTVPLAASPRAGEEAKPGKRLGE